MKAITVLMYDLARLIYYAFESEKWIYPLIWFSIGYFIGFLR